LLFLDEPTTGLDRYHYCRHTDQSILQDCRSVLHADEQHFCFECRHTKI
jgi:energy-coupling factor transporter ATP-binding protein EcfA2